MAPGMRRAFPLVVALALLGASAVCAQSIDTEIAERVAEVQSATDPSTRIDRAAHLAEYIASRGPLDVANVEPPIVDGMAELLEDNADLVRFYAAASLGFLGPSARRAIPALEKALEQREEERGIVSGQPRVFTSPVSSLLAICIALTKIDLSRVPPSCQTYR
jgi:HEAT repeat protein